MALTLLSTPVKTIQTLLSNVAGARSQLPYTFQRSDYAINGIITSTTVTGKAMLQTFGLNFTAELTVGQVVYCSFDSLDIEDGNYTVLAVQLTSGHTYTTIDLDFTITSNGYYNNLNRKNYKVAVWIRTPAGVDLIPILFQFSPNPTGFLFLDVGSILTEIQEETLQASLEYIIAYNEYWLGNTPTTGFSGTDTVQSIYAEKQLLDIGGANMYEYLLGGGFSAQPKVEEMYGQGSPDLVKIWYEYYGYDNRGYPICQRINGLVGGEVSNKLNWNQDITTLETPSAKVIVTYASNYLVAPLIDVVPVCLVSAGTGCLGIRDFPNTAGQIQVQEMNYSGNIASLNGLGFDVRLVDGTLDYFIICKVEVAPIIGEVLSMFDLPLYWKGFYRSFNFLIDANAGDRFLFTNESVYLNWREYNINGGGASLIESTQLLGLTPQIVVNRVATPEIAGSKYVSPEIKDSSSVGVILAGFTFKYEIVETCETDNLFYLGWINSKGGFEEQMFTYNQAVERVAEAGLLAESVINQDIEVVNRTKKRLPNIWTQQIILEADGLTLNRLKGLMEIKQSDYVVVNLSKDGQKEVFVIVNNGYSTIYDTKEELYTFTLQIEFPDNFDVFQAKEY